MRYLLITLIALLGFGVLAATYIFFGATGIKILLGLAASIAVPLSVRYSLHQDQLEHSRALRHMSGHARLSDEQFGATFFPGDHADVAARLRRIFAEHIPLDISALHPDDKLVEDIRMDALDSMSTVEFVLHVEKEFGISIPDSAAAEMRSFRDVLDYVATHIHAKA